MATYKLYYRPEWTCGRYNKEHQATLYYNLIEGMSYYFEDFSAMVMGCILSVPRNESFSISQLAESTGIAIESLEPFMEQLLSLGMITTHKPDEDYIKEYRKRTSITRKADSLQEKSVEAKLPIVMTNAETEYAEKVGGITTVMFELTYNCSEKCIHCYNLGATRNDYEISERGNRDEMTLDEYKRVIDELYDEGLQKVCLSGGDPFSKSFVWDIIDYLHSKEIAIDIFTNGQRLVGKTNILANYYPRLVGISLYSGIAEEHDYITRINGSWEKSIQVISELSDLAVPLNIKCCIMKPNVNSYHLITDIAKKYGAVTQFEVSVTDSVGHDKCVSKYLRLTPNEYEVVLRDNNIPLYVGKEAPNYGGQKRDMNDTVCGAGRNSCCITPEGDVIPCCSYHLQLGNIRTLSIAEILCSETITWWKGLTLDNYNECGRYDYCDYCNLCPGINFTEHGTPLKAGENNCYLAKVRHSLALKMMKGYDPLEGKSLTEALSSLKSSKPKIKREISR